MNQIKKTITVIPNEDILNISPYYEETDNINFPHFEMYNNFSKKYNLGYYFRSFDEPYVLVDVGHILIESVGDFVMCHCPSSITQKQYEELLKKREFFTKHKHFTAGIHKDSTCNGVRDLLESFTGNRIDYFYMLAAECVNRGRK